MGLINYNMFKQINESNNFGNNDIEIRQRFNDILDFLYTNYIEEYKKMIDNLSMELYEFNDNEIFLNFSKKSGGYWNIETIDVYTDEKKSLSSEKCDISHLKNLLILMMKDSSIYNLTNGGKLEQKMNG